MRKPKSKRKQSIVQKNGAKRNARARRVASEKHIRRERFLAEKANEIHKHEQFMEKLTAAQEKAQSSGAI